MTARVLLIMFVILIPFSSGTAKEYVSGKIRSGNSKILMQKAQALIVNCAGILNEQVVYLKSAGSVEDTVKVLSDTSALLRKVIIAEKNTLKTIDAGLDNKVWDLLQKQIQAMIMAWDNYRNEVENLMKKFESDKKGLESIEKAFEELKEWLQGDYQDKK